MIERYQNENMRSIWSDKNKYFIWQEIELESLAALVEAGIVPEEDYVKIKKGIGFDLERMEEIEQETRHDVVAFTRTLAEGLGLERRWIHYGLTSTDIVDTAYGVRYKQANLEIEKGLLQLQDILYELAKQHKYTIMMGRTHGIHAEITTFGLKMALYYSEMQRNVERFQMARSQIEVGKISGAVGTFANVDPFVQDHVMSKLGINGVDISTQTIQRDRHAFYFSVLAVIGDTLDKLAVEIRHLSRTEVREVEEIFKSGQTGSSAMPHKKNPISSENISGLSRVLRGYTVAAHENVALWHERDISHSSNERIISEEATSLLEYMLNRMIEILKNLEVNVEQMKKNIELTKNVFYSQRLLLKLIEKGKSREEAYKMVQRGALEATELGEDFREFMKSRIEDILENEEVDDIFSSRYHLRNIESIYEKLDIE